MLRATAVPGFLDNDLAARRVGCQRATSGPVRQKLAHCKRQRVRSGDRRRQLESRKRSYARWDRAATRQQPHRLYRSTKYAQCKNEPAHHSLATKTWSSIVLTTRNTLFVGS